MLMRLLLSMHVRSVPVKLLGRIWIHVDQSVSLDRNYSSMVDQLVLHYVPKSVLRPVFLNRIKIVFLTFFIMSKNKLAHLTKYLRGIPRWTIIFTYRIQQTWKVDFCLLSFHSSIPLESNVTSIASYHLPQVICTLKMFPK